MREIVYRYMYVYIYVYIYRERERRIRAGVCVLKLLREVGLEVVSLMTERWGRG